jgi:hypothetical protein
VVLAYIEVEPERDVGTSSLAFSWPTLDSSKDEKKPCASLVGYSHHLGSGNEEERLTRKVEIF